MCDRCDFRPGRNANRFGVGIHGLRRHRLHDPLVILNNSIADNFETHDFNAFRNGFDLLSQLLVLAALLLRDP